MPLINSIVSHFTVPEIHKIRNKYDNQLITLQKNKQAAIHKQNFPYKTVISLSNKTLTNSETETLSLGMNMTNNKSQDLKLKINLERFFKTIQSVEKQTEENSNRTKTNFN